MAGNQRAMDWAPPGVDICHMVEWSEARAYASLVAAAPIGLRARQKISLHRIGTACVLVSGGVGNTLLLNRTLGLGLSEAATQASLDALDEIYRSNGVSTYAVELSPCALPSSLPQLLRDHGFLPFKQTTMMYRESSGLDEPPSVLRIRRANAADANLFSAMCCRIFQYHDPLPELLQATFESAQWQHWLAMDGDRPVAAAMTHIYGNCAWIGWVCTELEFRGKGAQSALAAAQLRGAAEAGARWVTLEAVPGTKARPSPSLRNYQRLGWAAVHNRIVYLRRPL